MAFIGNTPTTQAFTPAIDYFSGTGSATAFTLSRPVASVAQVQVTIDNVAQNPSSAYTVSGNTITFTSAPLSGTNNIYVYYTSPITQVIAPGQGTVNTNSVVSSISLTTPTLVTPNITTGLLLTSSAGTVGQVLASAGSGAAPTWTNPSAYVIEYLIVAGGGAAKAGQYATGGGGGGAGGVIDLTIGVISGTAYSLVVGAGGAGASGGGNGSSGTNSTGFSQTAIGGGAGAAFSGYSANSGGSGGGGGYTPTAGASGTSGQGNAGGSGLSTTDRVGGGGGGYSAVGGNATGSTSSSVAGSGGAGINWKSLGTYYAGGGGGGAAPWVEGGKTAGSGGAGGGGAGARSATQVFTAGTAGTANTGGGAGGSSINGPDAGSDNLAGASGGSGIVIVRYVGAQKGSGGTVTTTGGYTYHTFTSSGTYTA